MLSKKKSAAPLYSQIVELFVSKISAGEWSPGSSIPSEIRLSKDLGVSHGTVRKAITELVDNHLLVRKQGKGTFVSNHNDDRALFHFFHITDDKGNKVLPDSQVLKCKEKMATRIEARRLQIPNDSKIIKIHRVRSILKVPTIAETIILPSNPFVELINSGTCVLPNMLYEMYERKFGITIHRAEEKLRAVSATKHDAKVLGLELGTPLLEIERIALTLDRTPVEIRISRCNTKNHYYQNNLI
jgi:GntR family transcriptional regulator